jgi:hypothetical protein
VIACPESIALDDNAIVGVPKAGPTDSETAFETVVAAFESVTETLTEYDPIVVDVTVHATLDAVQPEDIVNPDGTVHA